MRQRPLRWRWLFCFPTLACFAFAGAMLAAWPVQAADIAGSRDYPGIGRFKGSSITGYEVKDFDAAKLQAAAFIDGTPARPLKVEGRITRIAYRTAPGPSIIEVSRNFETQLAEAGFETLVACDVDACGSIPFSEAVDGLPAPLMWVDGFNYHYYAAHKAEGGRNTGPGQQEQRRFAKESPPSL